MSNLLLNAKFQVFIVVLNLIMQYIEKNLDAFIDEKMNKIA